MLNFYGLPEQGQAQRQTRRGSAREAEQAASHHEEDGSAGGDEVSGHVSAARDRPTGPAGQPDDSPVAIAHAGNPVQSAVDPRPIVVAKRPQLQTT